MSYNPKMISLEEARSAGIDINFDEMDNGEKRYRLVASDGSSYCRTVSSKQGAWQNSHYHKSVSEFYVVQSGWLVYAELNQDRALNLRLLKENESVIVNPYIHHNIFLSANTVTHTIKYGDAQIEIDWFSSPELDKLTKGLSIEDFLR